MKTLLIGPAGSGKTHRILDEFVSALKASTNPLEDDYFLILPSAEHVDRVTMLALQKGLKGFFKRRITTLSDFIRSRFSVGEVRLASSSARFMILRDLLASSTFPPFETVQNQPGFSQVLLQFFSELKESLVTPEYFRAQIPV